MSTKPALLIDSQLEPVLKTAALCQVSFKDLTGSNSPWNLNHKTWQEIRTALARFEHLIRTNNPREEVTCVISGQGVSWLPEAGMEVYYRKFETLQAARNKEEPYPLWKMTTAELFNQHADTLRKLVMSVAHDLVLMEQMRGPLGSHHLLLHREFEQSERGIRLLLNEGKDHHNNMAFVSAQEIVILERARITRIMLENGQLQEEKIGYSLGDLIRVGDLLHRRCKRLFPIYTKRLQSVNNLMKNSLREGEFTQLRRASRWELAFSLIGSPPAGYRGQAKLATKEREVFSEVVESREKELGETAAGQDVLAAAELSRQAMRREIDPLQALKPGSAASHAVETAGLPEELAKGTADVQHMAFINRLKRQM
ncbi:MAG: hypothetical protein ACE15F_12805 [bacterium]